MELIFADQYYDTAEWEEGRFSNDLASQLAEFDKNVKTTDADIGHGASWPVVLVEIFKSVDWSTFLPVAGAGGLFLLGDQINKGIDGWIEIGKKVKKITEKYRPTRIDENAATLQVINELYEQELPLENLEISTQIVEFTTISWGKSKLYKRPDALYIITARLPDTVYIYGIKSDGKVQFKHEFVTAWYEFNKGI